MGRQLFEPHLALEALKQPCLRLLNAFVVVRRARGRVFAYADPKRLEGALVDAGFKDVSVESVDLPMIDFDSFDGYWTWTRELVGPVASMLAKLTPAQQATAAAEVKAEVAKLSPGRRTVLGGTTWVASGRK